MVRLLQNLLQVLVKNFFLAERCPALSFAIAFNFFRAEVPNFFVPASATTFLQARRSVKFFLHQVFHLHFSPAAQDFFNADFAPKFLHQNTNVKKAQQNQLLGNLHQLLHQLCTNSWCVKNDVLLRFQGTLHQKHQLFEKNIPI